MNLFLDTSVLLAASGSAKGAARALFRLAPQQGWRLMASPYALGEVAANLDLFPATATSDWVQLRPSLFVVDDVVSLDRVVMFPVTKDRPILFTALAWADVLITLDRGDFEKLLGDRFYGLEIMGPSVFLARERDAKRLEHFA